MKYVIVGCGRVGSTLAKLLVAEGHSVTVVDENAGAFKRLGSRFSGQVELGTGIDYDVLKRAGCDRADGFIAVTDGDNRNVMAALIAQRMFKIRKIVARIYDPPRGQMYRELGIETVCPTTIGAKIIRDKLMSFPYDSVPSFDFGKVSTLNVRVEGEAIGMRVGDVERDELVRIAAIRSVDGHVRIPTAATLLAEGEEINAIVAPEGLAEFASLFTACRATRLSA